MSKGVKLKFDVGDKLVKAFKKMPVARIGVLGATASRQSGAMDGVNNAEVGAFHEFGTSKLPQRSFLRMPLNEKLGPALETSGAIDAATLEQVAKEGTIRNWMEKIGVLAEGIVLEAFATGGFGKWKASNMKDKKVQQTLVETQQLMKSITSEVVDG